MNSQNFCIVPILSCIWSQRRLPQQKTTAFAVADRRQSPCGRAGFQKRMLSLPILKPPCRHVNASDPVRAPFPRKIFGSPLRLKRSAECFDESLCKISDDDKHQHKDGQCLLRIFLQKWFDIDIKTVQNNDRNQNYNNEPPLHVVFLSSRGLRFRFSCDTT